MAFLLVTTTSKEPLLLHRARKIMDIPRTWGEGILSQGNYDWWSSKHIVAFLDDPSGMSRVDKKQLYDRRGRKVQGAVPGRLFWGAVGAFSPDRKLGTKAEWNKMQLTWTVYNVWSQKPVESFTITSRTPQPGRRSDLGYQPHDVQWSLDGKRIYQIESWREIETLQTQVTERPLGDLANSRAFPIVKGLDWYARVTVHHDKALVTYFNLENAYEFPIKEWTLSDPASTTKDWKLHAPSGNVFIEYYPSPDFKSAVWLMGKPSTKVGGMGSHGYPYYAVSLWKSGLHGENMRELGAIPFRTKDSGELMDHYQYFGGIQWNPDGKHVSFIYKRKLYLMAV